MARPVRRNWFMRFLLCCVSFGLVCVLIGIAYAALGMEPFGYKTVAVDDAKIQYIDFFTYYVDVLRGTRSLTYDFSNMMGGSTFGLFSYYLASPFNFLLYFFGKEGVYRFFNIAVALKLATAGATFCWYLQRRFADRIQSVFVIALSMGYALTEHYPIDDNCKPTAKYGTLGLLRATDVPEVKAIVVDKPGLKMANGAIGIGEITSIPTAPAISDAYFRLDGKRRFSLPLTDTPYEKK